MNKLICKNVTEMDNSRLGRPIAEKPGSAYAELDRLGAKLKELCGAINELEEALCNVVQPCPEASEKGECEPPDSTPLGNSLAEFRRQLSGEINRLRSLIARISI